MFRQLNFRSFFNFLGRNKLYAAINIFGPSRCRSCSSF